MKARSLYFGVGGCRDVCVGGCVGGCVDDRSLSKSTITHLVYDTNNSTHVNYMPTLLTNRDRTYAIRNFCTDHPLISQAKGDKDIHDLSFPEFLKLIRIELTPDQKNIARLLLYSNEKIVNVCSSHGTGKSHLGSLLSLYYVIVKQALVLVCAPTARQVKSILFTAIADNYRRLLKNPVIYNEYGVDLRKDFQLGQTFLREVDKLTQAVDDNRFWFEQAAVDELMDNLDVMNTRDSLGFALGFSPSDNNENATQGIHADRMLVVIDEACGISDTVYSGLLAIATGSSNFVFSVGNPVTRGNMFEKMCRSGHYKVTGFTHPNVAPYIKMNDDGTDFEVIDDSCLKPDWKCPIPGAVTVSWLLDIKERYGTDSMYWYTRVLAKFPQLGMQAGQLITPDVVAVASEGARITQEVQNESAYRPLLVGVDIGDSGDPTVVSIFQFFKDTSGTDTNTSLDSILNKQHLFWCRGIFTIETDGSDLMQQERNKDEVIRIVDDFIRGTQLRDQNVIVALDGTGLGVSLAKDLVKETRYKVIPVHFNATATQPKAFINCRAEMHWWMKILYEKRFLKMGRSVLPEELEQLNYEISGIRYELDEKTDKIKIIPKEDIKSILGCSPNISDSIALSTRALYDYYPDLLEAVTV